MTPGHQNLAPGLPPAGGAAHCGGAAAPAGVGAAPPAAGVAHRAVAQPRKPAWLTVKAPSPRAYRATGALVRELELHTVCAEARCPNKGECFAAGTATFLILGDVCTRACRFCSVRHAPASGPGGGARAAGDRPRAAHGTRDRVCSEGGPVAPDADEPRRVAAAAARLGLRHVVVTSVTRDDLPDGGAGHFAATVAAVRAALPKATVEVLIPDLGGDDAALRAVFAARPDVLGHNLETVPRLYAAVRPGAAFERSLELLRHAAGWARGAEARTAAAAAASGAPDAAATARPLVKTGLMVGLGESVAEVADVFARCAACAVDVVTVGQYLQPRRDCLPVVRYVEPGEFAGLERLGRRLGLEVAAAPLVRSSYRAGELLERCRGHAAPG